MAGRVVANGMLQGLVLLDEVLQGECKACIYLVARGALSGHGGVACD